jgi:hypothetical protein
MPHAEIGAAKLEACPQLDAADWGAERAWERQTLVECGASPHRPSSSSELDRTMPMVCPADVLGLAQSWDFPSLRARSLQALLPDFPLQLAATDNDGGAIHVSCTAFVDYHHVQQQEGADDQPLCVFDRDALVPETSAVAVTLCSLYSVPDVLDFRHSPLDSLPPDLRPAVRYLLLGPERSGTFIHQDPELTATWNVVTEGRKRWAMLDPSVPASLARRESPPEGCDWSIQEWFEREWPSIRDEAAAAGHRVYDFEHAATELVYVPAGWWHAVLNLEASVAITHNVLQRDALERVLHEGAAAGEDPVETVVDALKLGEVPLKDETRRGIGRWLQQVTADAPKAPCNPLIRPSHAVTHVKFL